MLADEFGEFRAKLNQSGDDVTVSVAFNILTDVPDAKRALLENYISNLKEVLK